MIKLKLDALPNEKPVRTTIELPGSVHADLIAYAEALARDAGHPVTDPGKLIVPMLVRFMATDRAFRKLRRQSSRKPFV